MDSMTENDFVVVVNHEEQYSVWPRFRELPAGWNCVDVSQEWFQRYSADKQGASLHDRTTCLDYIESIWTDIRPLSVRVVLQNRD